MERVEPFVTDRRAQSLLLARRAFPWPRTVGFARGCGVGPPSAALSAVLALLGPITAFGVPDPVLAREANRRACSGGLTQPVPRARWRDSAGIFGLVTVDVRKDKPKGLGYEKRLAPDKARRAEGELVIPFRVRVL